MYRSVALPLSASRRSRLSNGGGAYGFRIDGVPDARALLVDAPAHWPRLEVAVRLTGIPAPLEDRVDQTTAILRLRAGGWVAIDRAAGRALFSLPEQPADGALVHPHLAAVAVVAAYWLGRESFHAGGFVASGGVWGLLGDKEAGKSSTLASLALAGVPVVCDDVLVLDHSTALAGPRSVDLRADSAQRLGGAEPLGMIGGRERWRLTLEPVAPELPFRGWIELCWGERVAVRAIRGSERLRTLLPHRGARLPPPDPLALVELSAMPFLQLRRPRRWSSLQDAMRGLLNAVDG